MLLCGDSAHVFPPCRSGILITYSRTNLGIVGGQGIASGFRDAISVSWRLAISCRPGFQNHEKLFEAWYGERKQQLEKSLAATIVNGNFCTESSVSKILVRNWYLWFLQLVPSWRHKLELGQRAEGMTRYTWETGYPFLPNYNGGMTLPQVFCLPYNSEPKQPLFTDDVIFGKSKTALFQLLVLLKDPTELRDAKADLAYLRREHEGELKVDEATYLVQETIVSSAKETLDLDLEGCFRIIKSEKSNSGIWGDLPDPQGYDGLRLMSEAQGTYVIVRPDRFVFAVCNSRLELMEASRALAEMFGNN